MDRHQRIHLKANNQSTAFFPGRILLPDFLPKSVDILLFEKDKWLFSMISRTFKIRPIENLHPANHFEQNSVSYPSSLNTTSSIGRFCDVSSSVVADVESIFRKSATKKAPVF